MKKENIGIYKIENKVDGKVYIGQSSDLKTRIANHKYYLKRNSHRNNHLNNACIKYGFENLKFKIIEYCNIDMLTERENYWMEFYKSYEREYGYNLTKPSYNKKSYILSDETKKKMAEKRTKYEDNYLLSELVRFYKENGRVPRQKDLKNEDGYPTFSAYWDRFGSFKKALELSGLMEKVDNKNKYIGNRYTKERIEIIIRKFIDENSRFPSNKEFSGCGLELPSLNAINRLFGSVDNLKKIFNYDKESIKRLEKLEALDCLMRIYEIEGYVSKDLIKKYEFTRNASYYTRNFGGIIKACQLIGVPHELKNLTK